MDDDYELSSPSEQLKKIERQTATYGDIQVIPIKKKLVAAVIAIAIVFVVLAIFSVQRQIVVSRLQTENADMLNNSKQLNEEISTLKGTQAAVEQSKNLLVETLAERDNTIAILEAILVDVARWEERLVNTLLGGWWWTSSEIRKQLANDPIPLHKIDD